jgi:signal transduction histidine kinase/PAS domain-containing protein
MKGLADIVNIENKIAELEANLLIMMKNLVDVSSLQSEKLLNKIPMGLAFLDKNGEIIQCNLQFEVITERNHAEIIQHWFGDLISSENKLTFKKDYTSFLDAGILNDFEYTLTKNSGAKVNILVNGHADYDEKGNFLYAIFLVKENLPQKILTDKIKESDDRFKRQYLQNPIPTFTFQYQNDDFYLLDLNKSGEKMIQYMVEGNTVNAGDFFVGNVELYINMKDCYQNQKSFTNEVTFKTPYSKRLYVLILTYSFIDSGLVMVFAQDMTEKRQIEKSLKEKQQHYQDLFNNMLDASVIFEVVKDDNKRIIDARITDINKNFEKMFNCNREQTIGKLFSDIFPNEFSTEINWLKIFEDTTNLQTVYRFESFFTSYDRWFNMSIYSPQNSCFVIIFEDISNNKLSDLKLNDYHEQINDAQDIAFIGSWEYDVRDKRMIWSDEIFEILHCKNKNITPDYPTMVCLMGEKSGAIFDEKNQAALKSGNSYSIDLQIKRNDTFIYVNATTKVNFDANEIPVLLSGTLYDITERILAEKSLIRALEKAEESEMLKTSFLSNMSHEIRTPMNAINGFSSLLVKKNLSQDKKHAYANIIQDSSESLLKILENIIQLSKLESNSYSINPKLIDPDALFMEIFLSSKESLANTRKRNLEMNFIKPKELFNQEIYTDPNKIKQILNNLLDNAVKFTEQGSIEVGYYFSLLPHQKASERKITFYVRDTGVGIPKEKIKIIFEPFRQADDSDQRPFGGNGIGLTIAKRLAEMLGGTIGVESNLGVGSSFYFSLPCSPIYQKTPPQINSMMN